MHNAYNVNIPPEEYHIIVHLVTMIRRNVSGRKSKNVGIVQNVEIQLRQDNGGQTERYVHM